MIEYTAALKKENDILSEYLATIDPKSQRAKLIAARIAENTKELEQYESLLSII